MSDIKRIYDFAVKWHGKFMNTEANFPELMSDCFVDECAALGFNARNGELFCERYENAFSDSKALDKIINDIHDISLLGSAIFLRCVNLNDQVSFDIISQNDRAWFIAALMRLMELTECGCKITVFPEFAALKAHVEKLREELSMLISECDELEFVECKNIEMAYMLALGDLEYKAYELHCAVLRLKRKTDIIRAAKNRQEKINVPAIEEILDKEFEEYKAGLNERIDKMNNALKRSKGVFLTDKETRELKKLYRCVIKALHPDLHPDIGNSEMKLFYNAVKAYESGDLSTMRIIGAMVSEPLSDNTENAMTFLAKEEERLNRLLKDIRGKIEKIKSEYPYTLKDIVQSEEKTAQKKAELNELISELNEAFKLYKSKIEEMLRLFE